MTVVYPMKLNKEIISIVELKSREEHTNKAIAIKQLIYKGLEDYVINLCVEGRVSIGKVAEILDISIYNVQEIAIKKGIKLSASKEQLEKSKELLKKIAS